MSQLSAVIVATTLRQPLAIERRAMHTEQLSQQQARHTSRAGRHHRRPQQPIELAARREQRLDPTERYRLSDLHEPAAG